MNGGNLALTGDRESFWQRSNDEILDDFFAITAHDSGATATNYRATIRAALRRAKKRVGVEPALRELLLDEELLAKVMGDDRSLRDGRVISRSSVRGTLNAFNALIVAIPPPPGSSRADLRKVYEKARLANCDTVGLRHVLRRGNPAHRPSWVPSAVEIERVINALRSKRSMRAAIVADIAACAYLSGLRISSLLQLTAADIERTPDGRIWAHPREKHRTDRRPVLLRPADRATAERWLGLSGDAPLWTVNGERPLSYHQARYILGLGCDAVSVRRFSFHALRGAFARDLLPHLGIDGVMRAGGWTARPVLEHYLDRVEES